MATTLLPVSPNTLADQVTDRLRAAIIAGELAPGERLTEPNLAERMGISRSPVREALNRLEGMRLARRRVNGSAYVWDPTDTDVDEIMSLRLMIEIYAADHVIDLISEADLARLDQLIREQETAVDGQAFLVLARKDRDFHEYVVKLTRNARLIEWWDEIMSQWEVLVVRRWHYDPTRVVPKVLTDHRALLAALSCHDLPALLQLHRSINAEVCEETKKMLRVQAWQADGMPRPAPEGQEVDTAA